MKNKYKSPSGTITIFLCSIFTILLALILITAESAHIQAMKSRLDGISYMSAESSLGYFSLPLFEKYGILAANMTDSQLTALINSYTEYNLTPASGLLGNYYDLFKSSSHRCSPSEIYHLTDKNGKLFVSQIIRLMNYSMVSGAVDFLINSDAMNLFSKDYVDPSNLDPDSSQVDSSFSLSEFTDDKFSENTMEEKEAAAKKDSIILKIKEFMTNNSLILYVENPHSISQKYTDITHLPSKTCGGGSSDFSSPSEKALFLVYLSKHFDCYTSPKSQNSELDYQLEYLLNGDCRDDENLLQTIRQILHIRTGLNLAYLYTDAGKRSEAKTLAYAATGAIPVPFLVEFTQLTILSSWAYAESILDIRALLKDKKIPVFKSKSTWTLELENLLTFDSKATAIQSETGLTYSQYLLLLLYRNLDTNIIFRTMDLIQMDIRKNNDSGFLLTECITGLNYKFEYDYPSLFHIQTLPYRRKSLFHYECTRSLGY